MKATFVISSLILANFASATAQACTDSQVRPAVMKLVSEIAKMGEPTSQVSDFHITRVSANLSSVEGASDVVAYYKLTFTHADGVHTGHMIGQFKLDPQTCTVEALRGDDTN